MILSVKDITETLAANLRERRTELDLTQGQVAARAKVHPRTVQQIEYKMRWPSHEILEKIAKALEISVADLFHDGGLPAAIQVPPPDPERALDVITKIIRDPASTLSPLEREAVAVLRKFDEAQLANVLEMLRATARAAGAETGKVSKPSQDLRQEPKRARKVK